MRVDLDIVIRVDVVVVPVVVSLEIYDGRLSLVFDKEFSLFSCEIRGAAPHSVGGCEISLRAVWVDDYVAVLGELLKISKLVAVLFEQLNRFGGAGGLRKWESFALLRVRALVDLEQVSLRVGGSLEVVVHRRDRPRVIFTHQVCGRGRTGLERASAIVGGVDRGFLELLVGSLFAAVGLESSEALGGEHLGGSHAAQRAHQLRVDGAKFLRFFLLD